MKAPWVFRGIFLATGLSVLVLGLAACGDEEQPATVKEPESHASFVSKSIPVLDQENKKVMLGLRQDTLYIVAATWCPYCKKMMKIFNDPRLRSRLKGKVVLLFDEEEWPSILGQLVSAQKDEKPEDKLSVEELKERVNAYKAQKGFSPYFDASFFDTVTFPYYRLPGDTEVKCNDGVPSVILLLTLTANENPLVEIYNRKIITREEFLSWKIEWAKDD